MKSFNYIEKHFETIYEDQFDFHLYAIRKFTLSSYFEMIAMEDKVYKNKFAVKAALGMLKVAKRAAKLDKQAELDKLRPEIAAFKESKEYQKILEDIKKRDDDDDFKHDVDPKGYELYEKFLADPVTKALEFASTVARFNPDAAELHAKLIPVYLSKSKYSHSDMIYIDKLLLALRSLVCLVDRHSATSAKVPVAKARFFLHWLAQSEEQRKAALKDERIYAETVKEVAALGCPTKKEEIEKVAQDFKNSQAAKRLESANEYIKLRMEVLQSAGEKFEDLAIQALAEDAQRLNKV